MSEFWKRDLIAQKKRFLVIAKNTRLSVLGQKKVFALLQHIFYHLPFYEVLELSLTQKGFKLCLELNVKHYKSLGRQTIIDVFPKQYVLTAL